MPKQKELTPVEEMLAARAEAEAKAEAATAPLEEQECLKGGPHEPHEGCARGKEPAFSMFDERWEPPSRKLYDYEVVALVNRDCGRYHAMGLMLDGVEDVDAFIDKQLETYTQLTQYQAEYYRMNICAQLFAVSLRGLVLQIQQAQRDTGAAHQLIQQATKPSKKRRAS